MIVALASVGPGRSMSRGTSPVDALARSAAVSVGASGLPGLDAVMPTGFETVSGLERGARVKLAGLIAAVVGGVAAGAMVPRTEFRRRQRSPLPLALGTRSRPRRAPPVLLLG